MDIIPFKSVGNIGFEYTKDDIVRAYGEPLRSISTDNRMDDLIYKDFIVAIDFIGIKSIDLIRSSDPTLFGRELFEVENIFSFLSEHDSSAVLRLGFVFYMGLGISLPECFYDEDDDEYGAKVISVSRRGWLESSVSAKSSPFCPPGPTTI